MLTQDAHASTFSEADLRHNVTVAQPHNLTAARWPTRCHRPHDAEARSVLGSAAGGCWQCKKRASTIHVIAGYLGGGLNDRLSSFAALGNLAHSLCAWLVAKPPCKLLMHSLTGAAGKPLCNTPWSAYLNASFAEPPFGPVPLDKSRWLQLQTAQHGAIPAIRIGGIDEGREVRHFEQQLEAALHAAERGTPFIWELWSDLTRWAKFYRENIQVPQLTKRCQGTPAVTCITQCHHQPGMRGGHWSTHHDRSGAKCVAGLRTHSSLAIELRAAFFALESLAPGQYHDLHLRTNLRNGCDDVRPARVRAHVAGMLGPSMLPLVIHTSNRSSAYASELQQALMPRQLVFADKAVQRLARGRARRVCGTNFTKVTKKSCAHSPTDNYVTFATLRAIAAEAKTSWQLGYKPCGKPIQGWEGYWKP